MRKPHAWYVSYRKNKWRQSVKIMGRVLFSLPMHFVHELGPPVWAVVSMILLIYLNLVLFGMRPFIILVAGLCGYLSEPTSTPPNLNKETIT